ncbi:MAG: T9SS type A sorting domain-containing protein [Bacteroidia bacterium]
MKRKAALFLGILCVMAIHLSQGQPFVENLNAPALPDMEKAFLLWAQQHNPDSTKGWKWYARWQEHTLARADGKGNPTDPSVVFGSIMNTYRLRTQRQPVSARSANWMPIGPMALPSSPDPSSLHGMGRINTVTFHPADPQTFWVGVAQGGIWKTTNSGQSWIPLADDLPILRISDLAVDPSNPQVIYASIGDYAYMGVALNLDNRKRHTHYGLGVYKTTDGGLTWNPTGLGFSQTQRDGSLIRRVFVHPNQPNTLLAAGIDGIWKSWDGGQIWTHISDSLIWDIERHPTNPNILYASTGFVATLQQGSAGIMKSVDFGDTWTVQNVPFPPKNAVQRIELAISPSDPDYVYGLACNMQRGFYGLMRTTNGGNQWTMQSDMNSAPNILHWYEGSSGNEGQGTYDLTILVDPNDKNRIYTGGINLWGSGDGGVTWNGISYWRADFGPSIHADQHFLSYNPLDDKFYICNDGGIMRTDSLVFGSWEDAGSTAGYQWPTQWEDISSGMNITSFYRIGITPAFPDRLLAGAQDNSTFFKAGNNWINIIGGDGMECEIHPDEPNTIYGSYQYGGLTRSYDGGQNIEYGITNAITSGAGEAGAWTTPYELHPDDPDSLYAAFGNLWVSPDGGDTWTKRSDFGAMNGAGYPAPASALAISPANPQVIYLAKRIYHSYSQPSEMWRTVNGGTSWTNITAGLPDTLFFTDIAVSATDPMQVWVSVGGFTPGGKIFFSANGGDTWSDISLNLPNLPANTLVYQEDTISGVLYAGMDIGVWVKADTASQWTLYSDNLPNVIISELEIDPVAGKLYAATFGRGVWISDLVEINPPASLYQNRPDQLVASVYPNPGKGSFTIQLHDARMPKVEMQIVDVIGRVLATYTLRPESGELKTRITTPLPAGLYYLRLSSGQRSSVIPYQAE